MTRLRWRSRLENTKNSLASASSSRSSRRGGRTSVQYLLSTVSTQVRHCLFQKARLARIQIAKATSGAAFVSKKKAAEAKMAARAAGLPIDENSKEDIFEMQHHHLLRCLEKTTVRGSGSC